MKLVTHRYQGAEHTGALTADGKGILPLPAADMNTLIETMSLADLRSALAPGGRGRALPLAAAELLAQTSALQREARCAHNELETYYKSAADFARVDAVKAETACAMGLVTKP